MQSGPPDLSPRRWQVVALTAIGLNSHEIAAEMGITVSGVRSQLRDARLGTGTQTDRALTYRVLAGGGVDLSRLPAPPDDLLDDEPTRLVLRGLRYNVPDHQLVTVIAREADTHPNRVRETLNSLRSVTHLSDCGLLGLAFAEGILSGQEEVSPPPGSVPAHASAAGTSGTSHPVAPGRLYQQSSQPWPAPQQRPPAADPLRLLPDGLTVQKDPGYPLTGLQGHTVVAGIHVQPVRVSPETCRDVLRSLLRDGFPPEQWGPVLGSTEGRHAHLMLKPGSLPDRWRYADCRVLRPGTVLHLPPLTASRGPLYWAVPPAVWWNLHELMRRIVGDHSTAHATPLRPHQI
jgi:DNA-binding CsgD family transcriptional regulator